VNPFEFTYELARDSPPPVAWDDYERQALSDWRTLLASPEAADEAALHRFLEQNPAFVPGAFSFPTSGHGPAHSGVFSKPPLQGIGNRIPDFMWLATATDSIFPVLVEIESATKRWFTAAGQPRAEFTQARNQLVAWKQWLSNPVNQLTFCEQYGVQGGLHRLEFHPQFVLVYGRRAEFEGQPALRGARAHQQGDDEFHITFDRLAPDANARDFLTVRLTNVGVEAITFPPTVRLGPGIAPSWLRVRNRTEVALAEERMTQERRRFIALRLPYWDHWAAQQDRGWERMGDWE
jgi:hypothetical protein